MKNIFVYIGKGAYQAKDVENFLAVFEYDYDRISEFELSQLTSNDVLIIPGGKIRDYLPAMGDIGIKNIKDFVKGGGIYIGICAGSYIAGGSYLEVQGLGFFPQLLDGNKTQSTIDVTDSEGNNLQLINENGPDLSVVKSDQILLKDKDNNSQAIMLRYGQGKVYLFAAHPEGSVYYKLLPYEFSGAIFFKSFIDQLIAG